jgi:arylsulfatase A-like enzyme
VFVWKVPGVTQPGTLSPRPVDYTCIYPTLCALAGVAPPAHLEGRDITPLLKNPQAVWDQPAITTHGFKNHSVRTEDWRYIRYANGDEELYHNAADPHEYTNLAKSPEHAAKKTELARLLPQSDAPDLPQTRGGDGEGAAKNNKAKKGNKANKKKAKN